MKSQVHVRLDSSSPVVMCFPVSSMPFEWLLHLINLNFPNMKAEDVNSPCRDSINAVQKALRTVASTE